MEPEGTSRERTRDHWAELTLQVGANSDDVFVARMCPLGSTQAKNTPEEIQITFDLTHRARIVKTAENRNFLRFYQLSSQRASCPRFTP